MFGIVEKEKKEKKRRGEEYVVFHHSVSFCIKRKGKKLQAPHEKHFCSPLGKKHEGDTNFKQQDKNTLKLIFTIIFFLKNIVAFSSLLYH